MKQMKAYIRTGAHTQEVILTDVPVPHIAPDQVLVKVEAFGVGIHDRYFIPQNATFPYVIGSEGAGIIAQCGEGVEGFSEGDRVLFTTVLQPQGGSWAEYAVTNSAVLIPIPENVTFSQAATIPIAGKTALECMRELDLAEGDRLFVAGASGAIGTFLIQLAAKKGFRVSASASEKNHEYMKSLGLEKAVDYRDPDWKNKIRNWADGGVDAALAIQPGTGADSIQVVKDGGNLITVSGDSAGVRPERNITVRQMGHDPGTQEKIKELLQAISAGEIKVVIEKEYSFDEALQALQKTETRHARGKLVVKGRS